MRLDPAAGFPGALRVTGQHAQLVANDIVSATADMALDVSGPPLQKPRIDGRVTIFRNGYHGAQSLRQRRLPYSRHETSQSDPDRAGAARAEGQGQEARRARAALRCDARRDDFRGQPRFSCAVAASLRNCGGRSCMSAAPRATRR